MRAATISLLGRVKSRGGLRNDLGLDAAGDFIVGALMAIGFISLDARDVTAAAGYVATANASIESWHRQSDKG
ncbi:hypothetical protein [Pelagibius sp. Alg239-R121]|uniref:hypothetical protein n=1 Tax=Pelagibius sp. Alg239-R121 TaxID=2993448 RepID=UPI0024A61FEA|nr:hypothetical protein [Pelagibius sp. Alg239-R121]